MFDKDDTGYLDRSVVENLIVNLGDGLDENEIKEFAGSITYNRAGKISLEDFLSIILNEK
jgi:Ca2+-binding EF-hand superfamily protein